ncbi:hypothetical protein ACFLWY_01990 [Chloroflexota bacterium]
MPHNAGSAGRFRIGVGHRASLDASILLSAGYERIYTTLQLCQRLIDEELRHGARLEKLYDDLFYSED